MKVFRNCRLFNTLTDEIIENTCFSVTCNCDGPDKGRVFEVYFEDEVAEFEDGIVELRRQTCNSVFH